MRAPWAFAALAALAAFTATPALAKPPTQALPTPASGFDTRYAIVAGADLAALVGKPEVIDADQYLFVDPASGERRMAGYVDLHAVYDLPLEAILAVMLDVESLPDYMPYIMAAKIVGGTADRFVASYSVGINFLGIKIGYSSTAESVVERFPDGSVGVKSRMLESLDQKIYEHYTSWFLVPVTVDGRRMTYLRYYNRPGLRKPFAGMLGLAKTFTPPNSKGQVAATVKEAAKRTRK